MLVWEVSKNFTGEVVLSVGNYIDTGERIGSTPVVRFEEGVDLVLTPGKVLQLISELAVPPTE